jgi:hypothetical protein
MRSTLLAHQGHDGRISEGFVCALADDLAWSACNILGLTQGTVAPSLAAPLAPSSFHAGTAQWPSGLERRDLAAKQLFWEHVGIDSTAAFDVV